MDETKHSQSTPGGQGGKPASPETGPAVRLRDYENSRFKRGRPKIVEALWMIVSAIFVASSLPGSAHRRALLRLFGASIGRGVQIKPGLRVKFPWRLEIGADCWIGEDVWIDNLAETVLGDNCCLSQGVYICTGSHNWSSPTFDLIVKPVRMESGAWIAAKSVVAPGVVVGEGAVLTLGSVATSDLQPWSVYSGNPAKRVTSRKLTKCSQPINQ